MRQLAKRIAHFYDLMNPWDFNDAWESMSECIDCTESDLESQPEVIFGYIEDCLEDLDEDCDVYRIASALLQDVVDLICERRTA